MRGFILLLGVAACSGDDVYDLTGIYQVTADVESMPCGTDQAVVMPPAYLKFHKEMALGLNFFVYDECNDAAATDCPMGGIHDSYVLGQSNGWTITETESSFGGSCTLTYLQGSALVTGKMLAIEHTEYSDTPNLTDMQCTTDEAGKRGKTMPCVDHYHIDAMKL